MKTIALLFLTAGLVCMVYGESCIRTSDCDHEMCTGDGFTVACNKYVCTCIHVDSCLSATDCTADGCNRKWHCLDNGCRCF